MAVFGRFGWAGVLLCALLCAAPARGQTSASGDDDGRVATGLEVGGLPAASFDSDEGFGYGGLAQVFQYGDGRARPYEWGLQSQIFLTSKGRRDFVVFFDAPHLLSDGWRFDLLLGSVQQIATPYYGLGNRTVYDESRDADGGPDPYFYRFGQTRRSATFNLQRPLGASPVRFLVGGGVERTSLDPVPKDEGTTLFAFDTGPSDRTIWTNFVRGGLVWDTRDRQTGPRSGTWTGLLVSWADPGLGADVEFVRWTFTDRRYWSLVEGLVFAHRFLVQGTSDGAPTHELFRVQSSFLPQEGVGGAQTVRGLLKNRYVGRGLFVWNAELRWRVAERTIYGRRFHAVLSAFLDQGRVWDDGVVVGELLADLHRGYGGGVRVGMGENLVGAVDVGTSSDVGLQIYIGLGYLY